MIPRLNPNVRLSAYTHPYCIITVSYYNAEKSEVATCRAYIETMLHGRRRARLPHAAH